MCVFALLTIAPPHHAVADSSSANIASNVAMTESDDVKAGLDKLVVQTYFSWRAICNQIYNMQNMHDHISLACLYLKFKC